MSLQSIIRMTRRRITSRAKAALTGVLILAANAAAHAQGCALCYTQAAGS